MIKTSEMNSVAQETFQQRIRREWLAYNPNDIYAVTRDGIYYKYVDGEEQGFFFVMLRPTGAVRGGRPIPDGRVESVWMTAQDGIDMLSHAYNVGQALDSASNQYHQTSP
jgi:hypothetical protein